MPERSSRHGRSRIDPILFQTLAATGFCKTLAEMLAKHLALHLLKFSLQTRIAMSTRGDKILRIIGSPVFARQQMIKRNVLRTRTMQILTAIKARVLVALVDLFP